VPPLATSVPWSHAAAGDDSQGELDGAYQQLDDVYQQLLAALTAMRRDTADVATLRKRLELRLGQAGTGPGASELRDKLTELIAAEAEIVAGSRRVQAHVDAFRTQKESIKAAYAAARAQRAISEAYALAGDPEPDPPHDAGAMLAGARSRARTMLAQARDVLGILAGEPREDAGAPREAADAQRGDADTQRGDEERMRATGRPAAQAPAAPAGRAGSPGPVELFALRPGAPACLATRILFTAVPGPPDPAIVLLAAGTEHARHGGGPDRLIELAHRRAAAGQEPGDYGGDDFAAEFFPGAEAELVAQVAALAVASAPRSVADLRELAGLSQEDLADRLGVGLGAVAALERGDGDGPAWPVLAAYLEALGARLAVSADLGTERIPLARPAPHPAQTTNT
jgi:phage shock protein A